MMQSEDAEEREDRKGGASLVLGQRTLIPIGVVIAFALFAWRETRDDAARSAAAIERMVRLEVKVDQVLADVKRVEEQAKLAGQDRWTRADDTQSIRNLTTRLNAWVALIRASDPSLKSIPDIPQ